MNNNLEFSNFIDLVALMGRPDFDTHLLLYLNKWIRSKYFSILRVEDKTPVLLLCGTQDEEQTVPWSCGQSYVRKYHHYDDLYVRLSDKDIQPHQTATGYLCADDIIFSPYRQEIYEKNGLIQRLCGFYRDDDNQPILFNFYRHKDQGLYTDHEIANFEKMTPALAKMIQGHLALSEKSRQKDFKYRLKRYQPLLTQQEIEVCSRILKGMSYIGIAADLNLKESTIKTYRNRAFDKLGISFKNQLFSMFLHS